ncbi:MAG: CHASE2 domain-containing protein [Rhodospirillales bacterium]|nr:CHASE2 domain-containing protein [Rhodospirillales bacterium]
MDLRFTLTQRDATQDLVLVDIDPASLAELPVWPWPRGYHAQVIDALVAAGARRIAVDIDFSSTSTPEADAALRAALVDAGSRVILPVFKQFDATGSQGHAVTATKPRPDFAEAANLAFTNVRPEADSLVRRMAMADSWNGKTFPTFPVAMAEKVLTEGTYYIDFAIRPDTVPRVSFVDVLQGRIEPAIFANKVVLIGATAIELGDQLAAPLYRTLPGPLIEALAYESLVQGRALVRNSTVSVLLIALILAISGGPILTRMPWRRALAVVGLIWAVALLGSLAAQNWAPLSVDVTPWLAVTGLSFLFGLVSSIDQQSVRSFLSSMAAVHTKAVMRGIVEDSSDGVIVVTAGGRIEMFNPAAELIFRRPASEVIAAPVTELFSSGSTAVDDEAMRIARALETDGVAKIAGKGVFEIDAYRADGSQFPMEIAVNETELRITRHPLERRTRQRGAYICTVRDISERKFAEEMKRQELERLVAERTTELREAQSRLVRQERLAMLGQVTATVSHELRNPLGTIRSAVFVLRNLIEVHGSEVVANAMERIDRNVARCDRIIDELLDFTRKHELVAEPVVVDTWLSELLTELEIPADVRQNLDFTCAGEVLSFDSELLRRCFINIVDNACHALELKRAEINEGAELSLVFRSRRTRDRVEILIEDSGTGISAEILDRIFEPLFSTKGFGVGLGLVVVKRIMDLHGGGVEITSDEGRGTRALLWLPLSRGISQAAG